MEGIRIGRWTGAGRCVLSLLAVEGLLVALHLLLPGWGFVDLDREHNLPTWFASTQLAAVGFAALTCLHRDGDAGRRRWMWALLAAGFFYLSLDESAVIHEGVLREETLDALAPASLLRAVPPWQLVFAPVAAAATGLFAAVLATRAVRMPGCLMPAVGGLALWGLAFALEGTATSVFIPRGWYRFEVAAEELGEMAGATLLLLAFVRYAGGDPATTDAPVSSRRIALAWAAPFLLLMAIPALAVSTAAVAGAPGVHQANGERLLDDARYADAAQAFEALLDHRPDDLEALRDLGTAAYRAGDLARAEDALARAAALAPEDTTVRNGLDLIRVKRQRARALSPTPAPLTAAAP